MPPVPSQNIILLSLKNKLYQSKVYQYLPRDQNYLKKLLSSLLINIEK